MNTGISRENVAESIYITGTKNLNKDFLQKKAIYLFIKRFFDIVLSLIGLIILSPIFLIIAIAIKLESKGPVFFKHTRIGKGGKIIKMHYKLESLDAGNVLLYYRLETGTVYVVDVDISSSKIKSTKKYEENDLENKQEIVDNLSTNINEYFEKYKEKLQSEGRLLNVIITDTEVIINLNYT